MISKSVKRPREREDNISFLFFLLPLIDLFPLDDVSASGLSLAVGDGSAAMRPQHPQRSCVEQDATRAAGGRWRAYLRSFGKTSFFAVVIRLDFEGRRKGCVRFVFVSVHLAQLPSVVYTGSAFSRTE